MVEINADAVKKQLVKIYDDYIVDYGDCEILSTGRIERSKIISDELFFEEENVYFSLTYDNRLQKYTGMFTITEVNPDFIAIQLERLGIMVNEDSLQKYGHDETLQDRFWEKIFKLKFNELMKFLRKKKIQCKYMEKIRTILVETEADQTDYYKSENTNIYSI